VIKDDGQSLVVPLELAGCMIHFKNRLPTSGEIESLKQYCLTQGNTPWNPSSYSDQAVDKFYQQVVNNEQKNSLNTKSDLFPDIRIESITQGIPKLTYFDPSDAHGTCFKGKHANQAFHTDTVYMTKINVVVPVTNDSHYSKPLPAKIDCERLSPYFAFQPHDVIQHTLR
jgi:hypothetical protein